MRASHTHYCSRESRTETRASSRTQLNCNWCLTPRFALACACTHRTGLLTGNQLAALLLFIYTYSVALVADQDRADHNC